MANMITEECVNCGACERMCPAGGISRGAETYVIDPGVCTECVGFHHTQQCARVCPVDCSVIDPNNAETEAVLFARAKALQGAYADALTLGPETSHFQAQERSLGSALRAFGRRLGGALRGPELPS